MMIEHLNPSISRRAFTERIATPLAVASFGKTAKAEGTPASPASSPSAQVTTPVKNPVLTIFFPIFPQQNQIAFTGPFEVLSLLPDATVYIIAKHNAPI